MELVLHRYSLNNCEYLVCECTQNAYAIDKEEIRVMCSTNFGINITRVLLGPVINNGELSLISYNPDGTINVVDEREKQVFTRYMQDAGLLKTEQNPGISKLSRIHLCEHFLKENNFKVRKHNNTVDISKIQINQRFQQVV